jgi:acetyl esterase/lipase
VPLWGCAPSDGTTGDLSRGGSAAYRLRLEGAVERTKPLDVYVSLRGSRGAEAFARTPTWSKARHDVDGSSLSLVAGTLRGPITVTLRPDAWTPKDGKPITAQYTLSAPLICGGAGTYQGRFGGEAVRGAVNAHPLAPSGYEAPAGEIELILHSALAADREWKRIVPVTIRGRPGAGQTGRISTEVYRRGSVLLPTASCNVRVENGRIAGSFAVAIPTGSPDAQKPTYEYKVSGLVVGGRIAGTVCWVRRGAEAAGEGFFFGTLHDRPRLLREYVYKKTPQLDLRALVHFPADWKPTDRRAALVYFSGGAWTHGSVNQFRPHAFYLAGRGMVAVRADYRVLPEGRTMDNMAEDPRDAVRWVRAHADELGVDPAKIVVSGQSAGGHLAAASTFLPDGAAPSDGPAVSARANALVLLSSALHLEDRWFDGDAALVGRICPTRNLRRPVPPTLLIVSAEDDLLEQHDAFARRARELGARVESYVQETGSHTFALQSPGMERTCLCIDQFLVSLGYLTGRPTIEIIPPPLRKRQ